MDNGLESLTMLFDSLMARTNITDSTQTDFSSLAAYLVQATRVEDTFFRAVDDSTIEYFSLVSVSQTRIPAYLTLFELQEGKALPLNVRQSAEAAFGTTLNYQGRREETYQSSLDEVADLSPADRHLLLDARLSRKRGDYRRSITTLERITADYQDFYLAWFNLALAYEATGNDEAAASAYAKAAALEPRLERRDPSIYNTFGWFLFQQGRYAEAEPLFLTAVELDPTHPKAVRNLDVTKRLVRR